MVCGFSAASRLQWGSLSNAVTIDWRTPDRLSGGRIRLEILFSISIQTVVVWALGLTLMDWFTCYAAFALNWSPLQYGDHAWSGPDGEAR
jgi:hypothetical protein